MSIAGLPLNGKSAPWLFFIFQLPAKSASSRVSVWRKLQKYGALAWKNSAYVLPHTPSNLEKFQWLAAQIVEHRGDASIAEVARIAGYSHRQMIALFNQAREREYKGLIREINASLRPFARLSGRGKGGDFARLNRRFAEITAIDWFKCPLRKDAERLLKELEDRSRGTAEGRPERGAKKSGPYHGRLWMTRPRPEVDRVGSAWLIKNFIDAKARFLFSSDPHAHPDAVHFDMFEGEFTHVGDDCTFETLIKHFGLRNRRLRLIGQVVHDADLEDNKFGQTWGRAIDLILKGWGRTDWPDEDILMKGFALFDGLYLSLSH